jgi:hypothetical protein
VPVNQLGLGAADATTVLTGDGGWTPISSLGGGGSAYTLPVATATVLGGVKDGNGVEVAGDGTLSLSVASAAALGGVKQGTGISITSDGTLSVVTSSAGLVTSVDGVAPVSGNVPLNAVVGSNAGTPAKLTLWAGTAAQYAALPVKSPTTVYVVTGAAALASEALKDAVQEATGIATLESGNTVE